MDLGIGLLQQGQPELIGIQAVGVAIQALPHWQPAIHSLLKKKKKAESKYFAKKATLFLLSLECVPPLQPINSDNTGKTSTFHTERIRDIRCMEVVIIPMLADGKLGVEPKQQKL